MTVTKKSVKDTKRGVSWSHSLPPGETPLKSRSPPDPLPQTLCLLPISGLLFVRTFFERRSEGIRERTGESSFGILRSTFYVLRSTFYVLRSTFYVLRSEFILVAANGRAVFSVRSVVGLPVLVATNGRTVDTVVILVYWA